MYGCPLRSLLWPCRDVCQVCKNNSTWLDWLSLLSKPEEVLQVCEAESQRESVSLRQDHEVAKRNDLLQWNGHEDSHDIVKELPAQRGRLLEQDGNKDWHYATELHLGSQLAFQWLLYGTVHGLLFYEWPLQRPEEVIRRDQKSISNLRQLDHPRYGLLIPWGDW